MSAFDKLYERDEVFEEDTLSSGVGSFVEILVLRDAAYFSQSSNPLCVFFCKIACAKGRTSTLKYLQVRGEVRKNNSINLED